jgi:predicted phosphodiesterase
VKIAVISDIHANLEALKTTLNYLHSQKITRIICLGDVVGYGPRPNECIELVKLHCEKCLMGNHDHAVLRLTDIHYFNQYAKEAILWTRRQLTHIHKAFLDNLPFTYETADTLFVHSTPVEPKEWHYIFSETDVRQNFEHVPHRLIFIGHSHIPVIFSRQKGIIKETSLQLDLANDRYIINVGSVGQPRDGDPRASLVIYDDQKRTLEYVRLPYPIEITSQEIINHNLPRFLAMRLFAGQ